MEPTNISPNEKEQQSNDPSVRPPDELVSTTTQTNEVKNRSKLLITLAIVLLLLVSGLVAYMLLGKDASNDQESSDTTSQSMAPTDEKPPTTTKDDAVATTTTKTIPPAISCGGDSSFSDHSFGAAFCYPTEWGTASVMDAKIDTADTGYREAVRFSLNTKFIVGGVSDDWTTTVGRDVGCQEPSNNVPALSAYDTSWHDIMGSGMDVEFAHRSLPSSVGGYDMTEEVSNLLISGVCVRGHKVISGSRYRVISAAFYNDFSEAAGITTPKAHIDNPNVLFSVLQRAQIDALLASAVAY